MNKPTNDGSPVTARPEQEYPSLVQNGTAISRAEYLKGPSPTWIRFAQKLINEYPSNQRIYRHPVFHDIISQFRPAEMFNETIINRYSSLVSRATNGLRFTTMPMLSGIDKEKDRQLLDNKGFFAAKYRPMYKIVIPIFWKNCFDYAVIVPHNNKKLLRQYMLKIDENFPTPIKNTIQEWVECQNTAQLEVFEEPAKALQPINSGPITLLQLTMEMFNHPVLDETEINKILPELKLHILCRMVAKQMTLDERDFDIFGQVFIDWIDARKSLDSSEVPISSISLQRPDVAQPPRQAAVDRNSPPRVLRSKRKRLAVIPVEIVPDLKRKRLDNPGLKYAEDFAHPSVLIKNLPEICYRLQNALPPQDEIITSSNLPELWNICKCPSKPLQTLHDRQKRARFAEVFFKFHYKDAVTQSAEDIIQNINTEKVRRSLEIKSSADDQIIEAKRNAARFAIWFDICEIFKPYLHEGRYNVLCALPVSTTQIENMSKNQKAMFLKALRERAENEEDQMIPILKKIIAQLKGNNAIEHELKEKIEDVIVINRETASKVQEDTLFQYINLA